MKHIPEIKTWLDRMYDSNDITHTLIVANAKTNVQQREYIRESDDLFETLRKIDQDPARVVIEIYKKDISRSKQLKAKRAWHY